MSAGILWGNILERRQQQIFTAKTASSHIILRNKHHYGIIGTDMTKQTLYNALQIQPEKHVLITSNSYGAELQKKYEYLIFRKSIEK